MLMIYGVSRRGNKIKRRKKKRKGEKTKEK